MNEKYHDKVVTVVLHIRWQAHAHDLKEMSQSRMIKFSDLINSDMIYYIPIQSADLSVVTDICLQGFVTFKVVARR